MRVLFLDIDGVCNSEETLRKSGGGIVGIDPYLAFLVGKIQLYTDCKVVLSSSWKCWEKSVEEVKQHICEIYDMTPNLYPGSRGDEIQTWLNEHPDVEKYAILDDDDDMLPAQLPNFFQTSWKKGITENISRAIIKHLS